MAKARDYLPNVQVDSIEPSKAKEILLDIEELYKLSRPKTEEEYKKRIDDYFRICAETGMRPGIQGLCLALHISRQSLNQWGNGNGCPKERAYVISRAQEYINAYLEQAGLQGQVNPVNYIWLSKNWMGYRDNTEISINTNNSGLMPTKTPEQIAEELEGIPEDNPAEIMDL